MTGHGTAVSPTLAVGYDAVIAVDPTEPASSIDGGDGGGESALSGLNPFDGA